MAKTVKSPQSSFAHTKETLGSIIFALIIALVFRGFVGQAFVIPTGSMAPTLSGAHIDHTCSSCGYRFTVGMDEPRPTRVQCPNCNHEDGLMGRPVPDAGDGIFTLSWPFAVGGPLSPQRWDVVVFKAPFQILYQSPEREGDTNYIKRLVGMPGDILEIIDGDVYLAKAADVSPEVRAKLLHTPLPAKLTPDERQDLNEKLRIATKTPAAQEALWQVLFDADYVPTKAGTNGTRPQWKPVQASGQPSKWSGGERVFRYDGAAAAAGSPPSDAVEFLELAGKDFRDNYGYNAGGGVNIVTDLRLGTTVNWQGGDGVLQLCLSKRDSVYTAELRPGEGSGRTVLSKRSAPGEQQELKTWAFPAWKRNQPVRMTFANVDHHLEVRINDRVVWQEDLPVTAGQVKREPREMDAPLVRIGAARVKAEFSHLQVSRDVYYQENAPITTFVSPTHRVFNEYSDKPGWATRDNPMLLRDGEYFVLGDNSPRSLDSRRWWQTGGHLVNRPEQYRPGTVPADQMIGQAFCVYWPSWYRLLNLRVIPNIGEMRWIQ